MKLILKFDMGDEFEKLAAKRAQRATETYLILHHLNDYFIKKIEQEESPTTSDIQEFFFSLLYKYDVNLEDLP